MVEVEIVPWDVHEALTGAADAGADLETGARAAQGGGEQLAGAFGSAATAFIEMDDDIESTAEQTVTQAEADGVRGKLEGL